MNALLSVSDKSGIVEFARALSRFAVDDGAAFASRGAVT